METTITFHIKEEDKEKIKTRGREIGLGVASFCRTILLQKIKQMEEENQN